MPYDEKLAKGVRTSFAGSQGILEKKMLGAVDAELRTLLCTHTPGVQRLTAAARALFKKVVPSATEAVRHGWKLLGFSAPRYFACVAPMQDHVRIGFEHGVLLDDQWGLLESGGSQMKWITIRSPAELKRTGIAALIVQAAEIAQAPPCRRKQG